MTYRAIKSLFSESWDVEREYSCINGLSAWFNICTCDEYGAAEIGYTDGAVMSAQDRAERIAAALNDVHEGF